MEQVLPMWIQVVVATILCSACIGSLIKYWFSSNSRWLTLKAEFEAKWSQIAAEEMKLKLRIQAIEADIATIKNHCTERAEVGNRVIEKLEHVGKVLERLTTWLEGNEKRLDKLEDRD